MGTGSDGAVRCVADTHVHLYNCHNLTTACESLDANLARLAGEAPVRAAFFAERQDCQAFSGLREGTLRPAGGRFEFKALAEDGAILLLIGGRPAVYLFAGRQVISAERIEVLALATPATLPDGLPAAQVVEAVLEAGGVPVLGWSPGKWWFERGRLVRDLLARFPPGSLLFGDTALRPAPSPEPLLIRAARREGRAVIAGTDPLPFPGEERLLGSYATVFQGLFDPERPLESSRRFLRSPGAVVEGRGARNSWATFGRRWSRLACTPRERGAA